MQHSWKRTSLLTTLMLLALLAGVSYVFSIRLSMPSADIEFSPGQEKKTVTAEATGVKPENIILFLADGMGFSHLSLALLTQQSEEVPSVWQEFDVKGWHDSRSNYGPLTDSEASATAMATGAATSYGHIGIDRNGDRLKNVLELASENEYTTAIVTDSYIWDGTPAAFVAHTRNEQDARDILTQYASSELDLLFGELEDLGQGEVPEKDETLEILRKRFHLLDKSLTLPENADANTPVAALFEEDELQDLDSTPNLPRLTEVALQYLSRQNKPFVLVVECEEMDSGSHRNDAGRVIKGLQSIQETLSLVLRYAKSQGETLVVFTADHETGGLAAVADFETYPKMQIVWATTAHTGVVVPIFATGPGAEGFADVHRNWEIGKLLLSLIRQGNGMSDE